MHSDPVMYRLLVIVALSVIGPVFASSDTCKPDHAENPSSRPSVLLQMTLPAAPSSGTELEAMRAGYLAGIRPGRIAGLEAGKNAGIKAGIDAYEKQAEAGAKVDADAETKAKAKKEAKAEVEAKVESGDDLTLATAAASSASASSNSSNGPTDSVLAHLLRESQQTMVHRLMAAGTPPNHVVSHFAVNSQEMVRDYIFKTWPSACLDSDSKCSTWAQRGDCYANPVYMQKACQSSCHKCGKPLNQAELAAERAGYVAGLEAGKKAYDALQKSQSQHQPVR